MTTKEGKIHFLFLSCDSYSWVKNSNNSGAFWVTFLYSYLQSRPERQHLVFNILKKKEAHLGPTKSNEEEASKTKKDIVMSEQTANVYITLVIFLDYAVVPVLRPMY